MLFLRFFSQATNQFRMTRLRFYTAVKGVKNYFSRCKKPLNWHSCGTLSQFSQWRSQSYSLLTVALLYPSLNPGLNHANLLIWEHFFFFLKLCIFLPGYKTERAQTADSPVREERLMGADTSACQLTQFHVESGVLVLLILKPSSFLTENHHLTTK